MKISELPDASALIGLVYDSAFEENQWQSLTTELGKMFPGHVAAVATFEDAQWISSHVPTLPNDQQGEEIAELMQDVEGGEVRQPNDLNDVLFRRQPLELGTVYSTRKIFSEEEFRNFEGYLQTMKPIGAGHWTGTHFSISEGRRAAIMVVENDFDPQDKNFEKVESIIKLIAPHTVRAARLARSLGMARAAAQTYSGFVDAIALPLIILTKEAQVQMVNTLGQRLIDAGEIIKLSLSGEVTLTSAQGKKALKYSIAQSDNDGGPHAFQLKTEDANIAFCVCPYRPSLSFATEVDRKLFQGQNLFAVFIGARPSGAISLPLLQNAFELTAREAEVCRGLLGGSKPSELSQDMNRSEKTIRNQIQAVLEKVGVNSTRELIDALSVFRSVGAMYQES